MKASELRIGNWVKANDNGEYQVLQLLSDANNLEPIPLTEEWFKKFNATKDKEFNMHYTLPINGDYGYLLFLKDKDEYDVFIHIDEDSILLYNNIKYVHQLQNLYFALTGNELTIE